MWVWAGESVHLPCIHRQSRRRVIIMPDPSDIEPLISDYADDPDMCELVAYFVTALPERIEAMTKTCETHNMEILEQIVRQIKGASGYTGYPGIGEAAKDLESLIVQDTDVDHIRQSLESLVDLCNRAMAAY